MSLCDGATRVCAETPGGGGCGVEFQCSHETTAQRCDSSFSVRVAQLVASVLISTLTSRAGLGSYQSHTHVPSQRAQHTCDTCLTLHVVVVVVVVRTFCSCDVSVHATKRVHLIRVAERLGASSRRPRHPLPRPDGGGQPWPS